MVHQPTRYVLEVHQTAEQNGGTENRFESPPLNWTDIKQSLARFDIEPPDTEPTEPIELLSTRVKGTFTLMPYTGNIEFTFRYPRAVDERSGFKVGWKYYEDQNLAKLCADIAQLHAVVRREQGYDFGYCSPGHIRHLTDGDRAGLYEVCIP